MNRLERQGQDVTEMRRVLAWAVNNPEEVANYLPFKDVPLAKLGRIGELLDWRLHPVSQAELEKHRQYEKIMVPCFHECGWYDGVVWAEFENFNSLRKRGGSQLAREGQHIIAGPWPHSMRFQNTLGDLNFGFSADNMGSGIHQHQIAFFDKYVQGRDIEIPAVRYFVMGINQWRTADSWPLPQTQWQRFYLHSKGGANTAAGDGLLSRDGPGSEPPDLFVYDPHRPVPTVGGPLIGALAGPGVIPGPIEQSHVEKRHDVLCYTTPELEEDVEVTLKNLELVEHAAPFLVELSQHTKDQIPTIFYQRHDYAGDAARSTVVLNGKQLRVGGTAAPGVKVVEILPDSVVLSHDGREFRLRALNSWINL